MIIIIMLLLSRAVGTAEYAEETAMLDVAWAGSKNDGNAGVPDCPVCFSKSREKTTSASQRHGAAFDRKQLPASGFPVQ